MKPSLRSLDGAASLLTAVPDPWWARAGGRATSAGNGVPIWAGAAAVLAVTSAGGRRTAVEALAAMGAASAVSNAAVKPVVARRRPRRLRVHRHQKSTASFPSSHATTGAAFTTAVAWRQPRAGAALVPLVALVGASRVQQRQHFASDVVGGVALGVALGSAVHLVARRAVPDRSPGRRQGPGVPSNQSSSEPRR